MIGGSTKRNGKAVVTVATNCGRFRYRKKEEKRPTLLNMDWMGATCVTIAQRRSPSSQIVGGVGAVA